MEKERRWLTLSAASKLLGVHPATLRQWADAGQVPSYRTPGGHRRFDADELRAFLLRASTPAAQTDDARQASELFESALIQTRSELRHARLDEEAWYSAFDDAGKERQRVLGRQLFEIAAQFITESQQRKTLMAQGRELGQAYAASSLDYDISLLETVRAFQFFRRNMLQALTVEDIDARISVYDEADIGRNLDILLNEILYGIIDGYEHELLGEKVQIKNAGTDRV
jgi:excisionase family DNA binding protein